MTRVLKRKMYDLGSTFAVNLPVKWVREQGLKPGDYLCLICDGEMRVIPIHEKDKGDPAGTGE